ncbi:hypothetical protein SDC9_156609 [bioreactor metagenome]|uniref:Uncharacterized protein n=1 Tax=bioreactor metagenome TaxID=1076179 RepID=A0A645F619_9ZZZZ
MEHARVPEHVPIQLIWANLRVCARLSRKGEGALTVWLERDKRKRCKKLLGFDQRMHIHSGIQHRLLEKRAVHIAADLADEAGSRTAAGRCTEQIGHRSAGILFKEPHAAGGNAALSEINQQFAKRNDIVHITPSLVFICAIADFLRKSISKRQITA